MFVIVGAFKQTTNDYFEFVICTELDFFAMKRVEITSIC